MKKIKLIVTIVLSVCFLTLLFSACTGEYKRDNGDEWKTKFDTSLPDLDNVGQGIENANEDGWYLTLDEEFNSEEMPDAFSYSNHGLRQTEYWCDQAVKFKNGNAVISAYEDNNHNCEICGVSDGIFTGGIDSVNFEQAFGYYEARVKLPQSGGMWAAFWIQSNSTGNVNSNGEDGTEIDIFESSFFNTNRNKMGHALHYDGYDPKQHKCLDTIKDTGTDLYDGYHTFALKWTPWEYVFYIDGKVSWASDFGGVSKVPSYIRFTNEVRPNKTGPYGQRLKAFDSGEFLIDYVKVYQNKEYLSHVKSIDDFT